MKGNRQSIRLPGYDYSCAGAYFITICAQNRECLFGEIVDGEMRLNEAGRMVQECWHDIPAHFPCVELDEFVVMPNHVHGILSIIDAVGANTDAGDNAGVGANTSVGAKNLSPLPPLPSTWSSRPTLQPHGTSRTIGSIIRGLKIGVTKWMRQNNVIYDVWQRNYYEHIIRDDDELSRIRSYVINNPARWESDRENPVVGAIHPVVGAKNAAAGTHNPVVGAKNFSPLRKIR